MDSIARIKSIQETIVLEESITGLPTFDLADLQLTTAVDFELPTNLRLGHLAEKVVSELIKASANYQMIDENIQIIEDKKTIGELDFIVEKNLTKQLIHIELAYKFYLFDPSISSKIINNWIGPNRNDSLQEKLTKLKTKQFPLLQHASTQAMIADLATRQISQALCLLVSLFVPHQYQANFNPNYQRAIKGYYLDLDTFFRLDNDQKAYRLPPKKAWGMEPDEDQKWTNLGGIEKQLLSSMHEKRAVLCWQKEQGKYSTFFVVWW